MPLRFATHSKRVQKIAIEYGWQPSARYTNLRDVQDFDKVNFIDIDFKNYDFDKHLDAVKATKPHLTVAQDVFHLDELDRTLEQAEQLNKHADKVIIVPKALGFEGILESAIPRNYILGFSVPTKYGGTELNPKEFKRPVHLLGGRPDTQRELGNLMNIYSFDCNRFTLDAKFGDYFVGTKFVPHPIGGYDNCIKDSIKMINLLWENYSYESKF
ncbi:DUF6610 family protein [Galbibacter sp.]|uniref:DUF6610 family protein n=1 Tax=Galbibacter sp. TaxID=2918471 RepID=UPI003A903066